VFLEAKDPGWLVFYRYYQGGILTLMGSDARTYRSAAGPRFQWTPGEWHHLAGTWRKAGLEVYVDGKKAGFCPDPPMPQQFAPTFRLGDHPWHVPRQKQTLIDEVKLYAAPLDADSVARASRGEPIDFEPQVLVELTPDPEAARLAVVCDAAGLVGDLGPGRTADVGLVPGGEQQPVATAEIAAFPDDVGRAELSLDDVDAGEYEVQVTVVGDEGTAVARATAPFAKPGPPVWTGNTLGMKDEVLPPWTALKTDRDAAALECWDRRYEFGTFL
jgi:hypothetical protein